MRGLEEVTTPIDCSGPASGEGCGENSDHSSFDMHWAKDLARTIESEIIPRLMLVHQPLADEARPEVETGAAAFDEAYVQEFADLLVNRGFPQARAHVNGLLAQGTSLETILIDLFSPAARHLGVQWELDTRNFAEVTLGLSCLHQLVREFGHEFSGELRTGESVGRALFAPGCGDQHTFGLSVLSEFFRRDGWDVLSGVPESVSEILELAQDLHLDLIGFSLSQDALVEGLAEDIKRLRADPALQQLQVWVGGRVFVDNPRLAEQIGATATADDPRIAAQGARAIQLRRAGQGGISEQSA